MDLDSGINIKIDPKPAIEGSNEINEAMRTTQAAVNKFAAGVEGAGARAEKGFKKVGVSAAASSDGMKAASAAADALAGANKRLGESEEQATQRIRGMVSASIEQQKAAFAAARDTEAAARAAIRFRDTAANAGSSDGLRQSYAETEREIIALNDALSNQADSLMEVAEKRDWLTNASKRGLVSAREEEDALKELAAQEEVIKKRFEESARELQNLINKYDPASAALQKITRDEKALEAAIKSGVITQQQYTKAMQGLTVQRARWKAEAAAIQDVSAKLNTLAFSSSAAFRDYTVFLSALGRGDVGMASQQVLQLAGRSNALKLVLTPLGGALTAAAAAATILGVAMFKGQQESSAFNLALASTGNASGLTADRMEDMAEAARRASGVTVSSAREIITSLVQSGQFGSEVIGELTKAVASYAAITGQAEGQATKSLAALFEKPTEAAETLNKQFKFLTPDVYRYIAALEQQGEVEEARLVLSKEFSTHIESVHVESLGTLERAWKSVTDEASNYWSMVKSIGRDKGAQANLDDVNKEITRLEEIMKRASGKGAAPAEKFEAARLRSSLQEQYQLRIKYLEDVRKAEEKAAADAKAADASKRGVAGEALIRNLTNELKTNTEKYVEERKKLREAFDASGREDEALFNEMDAKLKARYADKGTGSVEGTFDRKRVDLLKAEAMAQNELANAQLGAADGTNRHKTEIENWIRESAKAQGLTTSQIAELRKLAAAADSAEESLAFGDVIRDVSTELDRQIQALRTEAEAGNQASFALQELEIRNRLLDAGIQDVNGAMKNQAERLKELKAAQLAVTVKDIEKDLRLQTEELKLQALYGDQAAAAIERLHIAHELERSGGTGAIPDSVSDLLVEKNQAADAVTINNRREELELSKMNNYEREKEIALKELSAAATQAQKDAMAALVKETFSMNAAEEMRSMGINTTFMQSQAEENVRIYADMKDQIAAMEEDGVITERDAANARMQIWQMEQKSKMQAASTFLGNLAQLQGSESKKMARIGKAAAIAQTMIKTYEAATSAYSSLAPIPYIGPALGAAAAAAALAMGLQNVRNIKSQNTGFMVGGYTGNLPRSKVAGAVHGQEYVVNAPTTARIGVGKLDALASGAAQISSGGASTAAPGAATKVSVSIQNYGTSKNFQVERFSDSDIRIIARDEASKEISKQVPKLVSGQMSNPNSDISKSMTKNTRTERRR